MTRRKGNPVRRKVFLSTDTSDVIPKKDAYIDKDKEPATALPAKHGEKEKKPAAKK